MGRPVVHAAGRHPMTGGGGVISIEDAALFFQAAAARVELEMVDVVATVTETAAVKARGYIGHPQQEWQPLSPRTIEGFRLPSGRWVVGKAARGFDAGEGYEPLRGDTGQLRDSIEAKTVGLIGIIGSDDKRALYQEYGTGGDRPIPPRPFLSKGMLEAVTELFEPLALEVAMSVLVPKE
jgi:hypothetical protein